MADELRIFDWARHALEECERAEVAREIERNPELALRAAEDRVLLEELAELRVEPSGWVRARLRHEFHRRRALRGRARGSSWIVAWRAGGVAVVAATVLAALVGIRALWMRSGEPVRSDRTVAAARITPAVRSTPRAGPPGGVYEIDEEDLEETFEQVLDVAGTDLRRHYDVFARGGDPGVFETLLAADNDLALVRMEFLRRFSKEARRRWIRAAGGRESLEGRIQELAARVADTARARIHAGTAGVADVALALRALLAAGSTERIGRHRAAVRACVRFLEERIEELHGGELAGATAALMDLAVVTAGRAADLVAKHAARLAQETLAPVRIRSRHGSGELEEVVGRPPLLHYGVSSAALADAGRVLKLAPAFGVHPLTSHRARLLVAAHLRERLERSRSERPDIVAAALYGFEDLMDRRSLDRRLLLWKPGKLAVRHCLALHHLAWSRYPLRRGWTEFQLELQSVAAHTTPRTLRDAAALTLALSMSFAAPGTYEIVTLAAR